MYIKFLWRAVASICVALLIAVNLSTSSSAQQTVIVPPPISSQAAPPRPPRYPPRNCITVFLGASRAPKVAGMASRQKVPFVAQTFPFVAAPTVRSMVWPGPVIYTIIVISIALILICFGPFYGANKISKLAARVTWPPGAKVSVKYQLNGREEAEILNPSFDTDGTVSTALTLSEATLRPGDTFSLKHVAAVDTRGVSTGNDIP